MAGEAAGTGTGAAAEPSVSPIVFQSVSLALPSRGKRVKYTCVAGSAAGIVALGANTGSAYFLDSQLSLVKMVSVSSQLNDAVIFVRFSPTNPDLVAAVTESGLVSVVLLQLQKLNEQSRTLKSHDLHRGRRVTSVSFSGRGAWFYTADDSGAVVRFSCALLSDPQPQPQHQSASSSGGLQSLVDAMSLRRGRDDTGAALAQSGSAVDLLSGADAARATAPGPGLSVQGVPGDSGSRETGATAVGEVGAAATGMAAAAAATEAEVVARFDAPVIDLDVDYYDTLLLASTSSRSLVADLTAPRPCPQVQVGSAQRQGHYGACFDPGSNGQQVLCARPGRRLWLAESRSGQVLSTLKVALPTAPHRCAPFCEPMGEPPEPACLQAAEKAAQYGVLVAWQGAVVSWGGRDRGERGVLVVDPANVKLVAWLADLGPVHDLCVTGSEVCVLHGPAGDPRLAALVEPPPPAAAGATADPNTLILTRFSMARPGALVVWAAQFGRGEAASQYARSFFGLSKTLLSVDELRAAAAALRSRRLQKEEAEVLALAAEAEELARRRPVPATAPPGGQPPAPSKQPGAPPAAAAGSSLTSAFPTPDSVAAAVQPPPLAAGSDAAGTPAVAIPAASASAPAAQPPPQAAPAGAAVSPAKAPSGALAKAAGFLGRFKSSSSLPNVAAAAAAAASAAPTAGAAPAATAAVAPAVSGSALSGVGAAAQTGVAGPGAVGAAVQSGTPLPAAAALDAGAPESAPTVLPTLDSSVPFPEPELPPLHRRGNSAGSTDLGAAPPSEPAAPARLINIMSPPLRASSVPVAGAATPPPAGFVLKPAAPFLRREGSAALSLHASPEKTGKRGRGAGAAAGKPEVRGGSRRDARMPDDVASSARQRQATAEPGKSRRAPDTGYAGGRLSGDDDLNGEAAGETEAAAPDPLVAAQEQPAPRESDAAALADGKDESGDGAAAATAEPEIRWRDALRDTWLRVMQLRDAGAAAVTGSHPGRSRDWVAAGSEALAWLRRCSPEVRLVAGGDAGLSNSEAEQARVELSDLACVAVESLALHGAVTPASDVAAAVAELAPLSDPEDLALVCAATGLQEALAALRDGALKDDAADNSRLRQARVRLRGALESADRLAGPPSPVATAAAAGEFVRACAALGERLRRERSPLLASLALPAGLSAVARLRGATTTTTTTAPQELDQGLERLLEAASALFPQVRPWQVAVALGTATAAAVPDGGAARSSHAHFSATGAVGWWGGPYFRYLDRLLATRPACRADPRVVRDWWLAALADGGGRERYGHVWVELLAVPSRMAVNSAWLAADLEAYENWDELGRVLEAESRRLHDPSAREAAWLAGVRLAMRRADVPGLVRLTARETQRDRWEATFREARLLPGWPNESTVTAEWLAARMAAAAGPDVALEVLEASLASEPADLVRRSLARVLGSASQERSEQSIRAHMLEVIDSHVWQYTAAVGDGRSVPVRPLATCVPPSVRLARQLPPEVARRLDVGPPNRLYDMAMNRAHWGARVASPLACGACGGPVGGPDASLAGWLLPCGHAVHATCEEAGGPSTLCVPCFRGHFVLSGVAAQPL